MVIADILLCVDSVCRNKRALTAADDDDKLLSEESVGEVWLSCESWWLIADDCEMGEQSTRRKKARDSVD